MYQFPYVRFHGRHYPLIPVHLSRGRYHVNTFALLDSGASISVFRPEIAKALHFQVKGSDGMKLGTVGGGVKIGVAKVGVKVEQTKFQTKIGFSKNQVTSFNILGRAGFFRRFSVCFNEASKTVILVPLNRSRS